MSGSPAAFCEARSRGNRGLVMVLTPRVRFASLSGGQLALLVSMSSLFVSTPESSRPGWRLVWHDEFDGTTLDARRWVRQVGGDGWGNGELEFYTDRTENARIEDGNLIIEARREKFSNREYTSARLKTQGLSAWRYGRIEARLQIPRGQGLWPAFWMLAETCENVGWPACGEIDTIETS